MRLPVIARSEVTTLSPNAGRALNKAVLVGGARVADARDDRKEAVS